MTASDFSIERLRHEKLENTDYLSTYAQARGLQAIATLLGKKTQIRVVATLGFSFRFEDFLPKVQEEIKSVRPSAGQETPAGQETFCFELEICTVPASVKDQPENTRVVVGLTLRPWLNNFIPIRQMYLRFHDETKPEGSGPFNPMEHETLATEIDYRVESAYRNAKFLAQE